MAPTVTYDFDLEKEGENLAGGTQICKGKIHWGFRAEDL